MKQLFKNLSYQTVYQVLAICLPLITTPYVSRVIGTDGLGIYSYTYSTTNYFTIIAMLGVLNYGSRVIATKKNDKRQCSVKFWEIYFLQLFSGVVALAGYCIVLVFAKENRTILWTQTIWVIACLFDISWFFFGIEKFKVTVIRNTIIKLLTVAAIFVFVKNSTDLWKYVVIMSLGTLMSQIVLWPFLKKEIYYAKPTVKGIFSHLKPNILLFIPLMAISVYHIMDKTMLGMFSTNAQSGYYYNADKIMNIPLSLITAAGTVMLPRMSALVAEGKKEEEGRLFELTLELFMFITFAMSFGISSVAKEFVPIFFGAGYDECIKLTFVFSVVMVFKSLSSIIRNQYLIPNNAEKIYTYSVFAGMVVNFICNYVCMVLLKLGAMGATLGTLAAETVTCMFYIAFVQKRIPLFKPILRSLFYILPGAAMFVTVRLCANITVSVFFKLAIEITAGAFVYIIICIPTLLKRKKELEMIG